MEIIPICSGIHAKDCPFAQMAEKKHARGKKEQSEAGSRKEQKAGKKKNKEDIAHVARESVLEILERNKKKAAEHNASRQVPTRDINRDWGER